MRVIDIPKSAVISILVGVISLWMLIVNGMEIISYNRPYDFKYLTEESVEMGRYVKGTISDCVKVPVNGRQDLFSGSDSEYIGTMARSYKSYTIPISKEQYIRVWLYSNDSIEGMENIVQGNKVKISFSGKIKKGEALNVGWYNRNPQFDQSKIVADYVIWEKTIETEENLCFVGLLGLISAVLIYYFGGGIKFVEE